ncbi:hypothetical protein CEN47_15425 [Fischerella thermalis CCMEE 5319]|jgi:hypothetical protein|nr:hypothetical protein CEN47_15425 [Fischerella thermalis CCMEE 5319]
MGLISLEMKKYCLILIFLSPILAFSQMIVDAGANQHLCDPDWNNDTIIIGGNPTATGGIPPYTYTWSITPIEAFFPGSGIYFNASDLLNDTTIPNPVLIEVYPMNCLNTNYFRLTVTDALGTTLTDSVQITASSFFHHLLWYGWTINQGDSVFLNEGSNVGGGIGNLSYLWQPSHGLSDTTLFTGFWAKPNTTIEYYVTVTDSMGCQRTGSPLYYITVNPLSTNSTLKPILDFNIYPNPTNNYIIVETDKHNPTYTATITDIHGKIIRTTLIKSKTTIIITDKLTTGFYFISISDNKQILRTKKLVKE